MKILHIFGAVVAVHLAVFLVIFAVPGCRSTGKSPQATATPDQAGAPMGSTEASPLSAPSSASAATDLNGVPVAYTPAASVRFSPTRPGNAAASANALPPSGFPEANSSTTYVVVKGDSLWTVAKKNGVSVNDLVKANNLKSGAPLQLGQKLSVPASNATPASAADKAAGVASSDPATGPTHTVKGGETLGQIARMHATTVNTLKKMNKMTSDNVRPGRVLLLPESSASSMEIVSKTKSPAASSGSRSGAALKHTVKGGETLGAIARKYNVSAGELSIANNITDPRKLRPGQELTIPGGTASKSSAPASSTSRPASTAPAQAPTAPPVESTSPLTPVESDPVTTPNTDVPVIRIEDPSRTPGTEAPRVI